MNRSSAVNVMPCEILRHSLTSGIARRTECIEDIMIKAVAGGAKRRLASSIGVLGIGSC
jgi:hypothetical protein